MMRRALVLALLGSACTSETIPPGPSDGGNTITCAAPTAGPTMHGTGISAGETWTAAASPHITTSDFHVYPGAKLTLEPCAEVRLSPGNFFYIDGDLEAVGTAEQPITITTARTGERFAAMVLDAQASAVLAHVGINMGGDLPSSNFGATIQVRGRGFPPVPTLKVNEVRISGSAGVGIYFDHYGAFVSGSSGLRIDGSGAVAAQYPYPLHMSFNTIGTIPSGSYTGNARDEIQVVGESPNYQSEIDDTFRQLGVPYYVGGNGQFGRLEVVRSTLTIEAGVTMHFESSPSNVGGLDIRANGVLHAVGTAANPVVLSSTSDKPAAGAWEGLTFVEALGSGNRVEHVRVQYAGGHGGDSSFGCAPTSFNFATDAAIKLFTEPGESFIHDTLIADSSTHGIFEAWNGAYVDLASSNSFMGVVGCNLVSPKDPQGNCPTDPPCPK